MCDDQCKNMRKTLEKCTEHGQIGESQSWRTGELKGLIFFCYLFVPFESHVMSIPNPNNVR